MKRVLVVLESSGASPQDIVRGKIFSSHFSRNGIEVVYRGRIPGIFTNHVTGRSFISSLLLGSLPGRLMRRISSPFATKINEQRILNSASAFDAIHLIKISSPSFIKKLRGSTSARLVFDIGDSMWLPAGSENEKNIQEIFSLVDAVTCDNHIGLAYASKFNKQGYIFPPPSQVEQFEINRPNAKPSESSRKIILGWIGSPSTLFNLFEIWEPLEKLFREHKNLHLRLVGVGGDRSLLPCFEHVSFSTVPYYSTDQMIEEVRQMDIGLFPMFDNENSAARGFLKALIYMSGEAAVICSPRGDCGKLIKDGVNGMLADSPSEWHEKLVLLIQNSDLRHKMAKRALAIVKKDYTLDSCFDYLRKALQV